MAADQSPPLWGCRNSRRDPRGGCPAAAAAPATEDEEEGEEEEGEEDEEEEVDEDEWVPGAFEAPAALALPSVPVPLAAAPEDCFDCMQCN